jgi:hypothetical protein
VPGKGSGVIILACVGTPVPVLGGGLAGDFGWKTEQARMDSARIKAGKITTVFFIEVFPIIRNLKFPVFISKLGCVWGMWSGEAAGLCVGFVLRLSRCTSPTPE